MASYTGGSRATSRIQALEQSRRRQQDDVNRRRADIAAASDSAISAAAVSTDGRFAARSETVEDLLKSDTVGLVTHGDFKARRKYLERCAAGERERRDAQLRERESLGRRARLQKANRATLSFATPADDDEDDGDSDSDSDSGNVDDGADGRCRNSVKGVTGKRAAAQSVDKGSASESAKEGDGEKGKASGKAEPAETEAEAKQSTVVSTGVGTSNRESKAKPEPEMRDNSGEKRADNGNGDGNDSAGDGDTGGDSEGAGASRSVGLSGGAGRKRRRLGMNPDVDTKFLPDRERELAERRERSRLKQEWLNEQERIKREVVRVTYSYWDGCGHRRVMSCEKGTTIGRFLAMVQTQFRELRNTSADGLMFIKEDLIIPHHYSFYDFFVSKARGKSGPLFNFDVVEEVRLVADASKEKEDAHAGKVVERRWYERNRHIFPASRWEVYDPTKTYSRYTIHGD